LGYFYSKVPSYMFVGIVKSSDVSKLFI